MSLEKQQQLEKSYVMPTFARKAVELVYGGGMYAFDADNKPYLDFLAGIGVASLGHCYPTVTEALCVQAAKLIHVGNFYYIEHRGEVAEMLSNLLNEEAAVNQSTNQSANQSANQSLSPWKTFFANSGAEANECAIKLARLYAKRQGRNARDIITLQGGFHGRTLGALAATGQSAKQADFEPLPAGFATVPINDIEKLEKVFKHGSSLICAVMLECVQGESGVHPCSAEFLRSAQRLAHECGALLICDEIQTGIYRCGEKPFAFQNFGIKPDIVTIAKGVASGFPVGMCAARGEVADKFTPGDHGTTFGGSSLAIAATKATLETFAKTDITKHIEETGSYLRSALSALPQVREVRGMGLMNACDLNESLSAPEIVEAGIAAGLLFNATGPHTLRFLPPLICEKKHVDELIEKLKGILDKAS